MVGDAEWSRRDDQPDPADREFSWGFSGTMSGHAEAAWLIAFAAIQRATGADPDAAHAFLGSYHSRHFADEVGNTMHAGASLTDAIA